MKRLHSAGRLIVAALVILTLGTMLAAKSCQQVKPKTPMCQVPMDCMELPHLNCDGNWTCGQGQCMWQCGLEKMPCLSNSDCFDDAVCVLMPCPGAPCNNKEDCPPCWGSCQEKAPYGGECGSNEDCKDGQECLLACPPCPPGWDCPCIGKCIDDKAPQYDCQKNANCDDDQFCKIKICADKKCPPDDKECMDEAECWGNCIDKPDEELPPGACLEEGDCADGEECIKGMCPGAPCSPEWCPPCYGKCKATEPDPLEMECMSSGCSGEICAAQPMISVCLWKPEYACYKLTECAANADGDCAWQENAEFLDCMKEFKDSDSKP